ncbi:VOC family protein [Pengzhenrongella frigida]|uniref:VOC family protein n=1 Tax=Pengzhenrongella frigida TaxID=1259133 RepID=A0A4Q5N5L1_9MICO|nr:VOC family protein [Cellulomonas sp. HLT2-17]RYV52823.1 VOC family protein [Cellulomonas sp. HLT2-17]
MSEQDRFVPGVPNWVELTTPDLQSAQDFYGALFGWTYVDAGPAPGGGRYLLAQLSGGAVGALVQGEPGGWHSYVLVDSVDETAKRVRAAGGLVLGEPTDVEQGRVLAFTDPEGAQLRAWESRGRRGADVVNAHGSVNFNDLHTRDTAAAAEFYAAVFGWRVLDLGGGMVTWALRAYGDHLERRSPGTRESYASMGGPEGFEDVVASIAPVDGDGAPAFWGVTFAVEDADSCAARASELGGRVLSGPIDAPWVRTTVLQDPHGASFVASQYVPPSE